MQNEQSPEEMSEFFDTFIKSIDNIYKSDNINDKIDDMLSILKTIFKHSKATQNLIFRQDDTIHLLNKSSQASIKLFIEFENRITKLEKMVTDIATYSATLAEQIQKLAEISAKIPVIDVDNLLKTLNEHANEINENTASIKAIKDKLNL